MTLPISLAAALAVTASLSRTLTLLSLWQRKEWRWDRLREHLLSEGIAGQLYGRVEPIVALTGMLAYLAAQSVWIVIATFAVQTAWGFVKSAQGRQPTPVWTRKAILVCIVSLALSTMFAFGLADQHWEIALLLIVPLITPLLLIASWLITWPIDAALKKRILIAAKRLRSRRDKLTVVGVTGSVGKTTTKELIAHILTDKKPLWTPAHVNTELGVANWMRGELPKNPEAMLLIVEMGAYRPGEIALLCSITQPRYGVITFIGDAHLGLFGSRQAICNAKSELFASLPQDGTAFINADSPFADEAAKKAACPVVRAGTGGSSDIAAFDIEEIPDGIRFSVNGTIMNVPLRGTHNVTNVLLAIAVAQKFDMALEMIAQRLKTFAPPHQTFEREQINGVTVLNDTYNCSPESFKAAIAWSRTQPQARKILVTSGILELGENGARIHTDIGAMAKDVFAEVYFLNETNLENFAAGFGSVPPILADKLPSAIAGDLLVCVGRMPRTLIDTLLPH